MKNILVFICLAKNKGTLLITASFSSTATSFLTASTLSQFNIDGSSSV